MNHKQLYDLLHDLRCNHHAIDREETIYSRAIDMIAHLANQNNRLQTIASTGWVEGWNDGNGFMALPPDGDHSSVHRAWQESETLERLKHVNGEIVKPACEYCNGVGSIKIDFEHPQWVQCEACRDEGA